MSELSTICMIELRFLARTIYGGSRIDREAYIPCMHVRIYVYMHVLNNLDVGGQMEKGVL